MTGLSILLLTRTREVTDNLEEVEATYLSVRMSGVEVAQVGMSDLMRQNSLVPLRIAMNDGAIGVTYDGVPLISALLVAGLQPTADWALSLSATTGTHARDVHAVDNLRLTKLAGSRAAAVAVEASSNLQDYSTDALEYSYYVPPPPAAVSPAAGPLLGLSLIHI